MTGTLTPGRVLHDCRDAFVATLLELAETDPANGNLADRIRALQTHASRLPHSDEPKSRN